MKKIILFFLVFVLISKLGLAQSSSKATATATIIDISSMLKEYKTLSTKADTMRVVDSLFQSTATTANQTLAIGFTKDLVLQILGQPLEVIILPDGYRKKWIYKDQFVYFKNDIVEIVQKRNTL